MAGRVLRGGTRGVSQVVRAAVLLLAVTAAACSSNTSQAPNNGSGTPADAAGGYVDALLGSDPSAACDYVLPASIPACQSNIVAVHFTANGQRLGNSYTDGTQAVVVVEETSVCVQIVHVSTTVCGSNGDPNAGLPATDADFASIYQQALNGGQAALIACTQVNGLWYVDTGAATGTTGATGSGATGSGATGTGATGTGATGATGGGGGTTGGTGTTPTT
jgi:hypothetical protein